ncbi:MULTISPECIES: S8 family serine peptidase [Catenuloplanes]|uniref:Subtilisin family serine protease n=1 Tax=Catenuloplanes niger TaxID=587534 RepID=A0AAE4CPZ4_9ACTN|nr:S8 family serine peptidase [Catenuloplanes niger]MDR7320455.1 subtilisin family serine protease [Catenuloplanes niger]
MTLSFHGRSVSLIVATATLLAATPPAAALARPAPPPASSVPSPAGAGSPFARPAGPGAGEVITLITGDRVTVTPAATTVAGPDGEPVGARVTTAGGDTFVVPDRAAPYLAAGVLDRRLFNVSLLLRDGYRDQLPLIVAYRDAPAARRSGSPLDGSTEVRALPSVRGSAVTTDADRAGDLWASLTEGGAAARTTTPERAPGARQLAHGVEKVWLDGRIRAALADTTAQIGAPGVWAGGNTAEGVDVAVLDTGVDADHPDLAGQIESSVSFVPGEDVTDRNGHGTHVASTIAGTGAASDGRERGVAPGADLQVGKVLNNGGGGQESWAVAGMEWAALDRGAKVISMSLGGSPTDGTDPMSAAVNRLSAETGALFVIAAGNDGPWQTTVGTPGAADAALTVGAVDAADAIADFSSRGPRLADRALKPEITAPGVGVLAARSQFDNGGTGAYRAMNGTSMATPHVAGAAALLAAEHTGWTGGQLKDALVSTAAETPGIPPYEGGSGRVDIARTTAATVFATGTAYLGIHPRGGRAERPVTYTNLGTTDVTLGLTLDAPGVPEGLLSLSAPSVTVPAGGTATVTVTADLSRTTAKGSWTARVAAGGLADTVIGVSTEEQPRHLVITSTGRDGEPMAGEITLLREGDPAGHYLAYLTGGTLDVLVPEGRYSVWMWGEVEGVNGPHSRGVALVTAPDVVVTGNTAITLDASRTQRVDAITPRTSADAVLRLDYHRKIGDANAVTDAFVIDNFYDSMWVTPGETVPDGEMSVTARWRKTEPVLRIAHDGDWFDDLHVLPGSALPPAGSRHLNAVFAGSGDAAGFAAVDARRKIAVVRRGDIDAQVEAAEAAGAAMLLIVNDEPGRYFDGTSRTPVAVASVTRDAGERLIAALGRAAGSLRVVSDPVTDYTYDLVRHWDTTVPASVTYRPAERELARVDSDFRNAPDDQAYEYRYDLNPHLTTGVGFAAPPVRSGRFRTDWVTVQDGVRWISEVNNRSSGQWGASTAYRAGTTVGEQWFGAIVRPRITDFVRMPHRTGNRLRAEIIGWGDSGAAHSGLYVPGVVDWSTTVYQGGTVVDGTPGGYLDTGAELSPARLPYRMVVATERDPAADPYSVTTRTAWDFVSGAADTRHQLPLIQLDYAVDTGLDRRAARNTTLTVTPSHLPGGPATSSIGSVTVAVSYDDGRTWTEQRVRRTAAGWTTELRAPAGAEAVTIRAGARDAHGNAVEQTITRAFGLR